MVHKIALVGIGKIAVDQHIPAITNNPDFELSATVSRHASIDGVESYTSLDDMLEKRPDIGIVSLAIPPQPRFDYAVKALRAGRHVMLEKPPGQSLAECYALEKMAQEKGVSLFATWHSRFADSIPAAKDWLKSRTIKRFRITWKEDVRRWHPGQEWIWEPGGLGVFDPGINALSIMTEILPYDVHINAAKLEFPSNRDTPIAAHLAFTNPDNAVMDAVFDWRQEGPQTWDIDIETDQGEMKMSSGGAKLSIDGKSIVEGSDHEYANLYAQMHTLVQNRASDVDLSPMIHVCDAYALGKRITIAEFEF
ncbi:Gfo/Idh/MocA family protein [Ahrensia marina]|uniref:Galactose 1-dehydrogenase n=1 Tax=Ahrensia marina TaxID=1514904 RepID=A0A0N0E8G6_9HYPH|nr:Gfo/Idh/MocA family oxidoreductase [Ahrensia marina]KPB02325.1 galactose 1-dehydrogenase [Ahrensia marina]